MAPLFRPAGLPFALIASLSALSLLVACSPPQGAGEVSQVLAAADFAVLAVSRATLPVIASWPRMAGGTTTSGWLPRGGGSKRDIVAPGDRFDVTMYSNEDNGLLSSPGQKITPLQGLKVSSDGTLFLPYAGAVTLAGLSEDQARHLTIHGVHRNEDGSYSWKFDNYLHLPWAHDTHPDQVAELWQAITCDVLLMYGEKSWASNPSADGRLAHFRGARCLTFENAGHWLHHDQFSRFVTALHEFL